MTGPALGAAVVEREDLLALTHDVRNFKEALSKLRHVFAAERGIVKHNLIQFHQPWEKTFLHSPSMFA